MNLIKYIYNKIKSSWDNYWIEYEKQMSELSPEEYMQIMNITWINNYDYINYRMG